MIERLEPLERWSKFSLRQDDVRDESPHGGFGRLVSHM